MNIKELTEEYNKVRETFNFPTVSASESGIESLFKVFPELNEYEGNELIKQIAWRIYLISFN